MEFGEIDNLCVNALRVLSVEAIEKAKSGHPGMPLGAAPMAYVLWMRFLRFNPENPSWFNRDRFILSAGHGSALLYSLLYLTGYDLCIEDIKNFRQWESKTPGHPEFGITPGVEVTTGPLGQGFAMGVGMAIAEKFLSSLYNKPSFPVIDHRTFAIVSDGDLMEGISSEAASLAGTLKLGKLIYLYDQNFITIEGSTRLCFDEDVSKRFESYGWHTVHVDDGNDLNKINSAIEEAINETLRPSLILVRTHIGYGSPKQDSEECHGAPLGKDALEKTKENLGWMEKEPFKVPDEVLAHMRKSVERGRILEENWRRIFEEYERAYPQEARELKNFMEGKFTENIPDIIRVFSPEKPIATRSASGIIINEIAKKVRTFIGGSADLAPSVKTLINDGGDFSHSTPAGRNIRFGVREHAMGAILNGLARHGGILPYGGTFLVFSDYMRPAVRLSAMMKAKVIFLFSHDSIGVGEDGPTHQPVEQLMSLRLIPNLVVFRPADANETSASWRTCLEIDGPCAIILTRQDVPVLDPKIYPVFDGVPKGGYILRDSHEEADVILLGTGSEVHLLLEAQEKLKLMGISSRVVSMPSVEIFERQKEDYINHVLPPDKPVLVMEAGVTRGWERYTGKKGKIIGVNTFGASAPGKLLYEKFGLTVENVIREVKNLLQSI